MHIQRIAAFSDGPVGGNPAGVVIADTLPSAEAMQRAAAEIGYSETAFAAPEGDGWRVRYFAPAIEVPFCGHATIALGAALAGRVGDGVFRLRLNDADITVQGSRDGQAALQSPPTRSRAPSPEYLADALTLFGLSADDLDPAIPPALAHAGANHLILALRSRARLAVLAYAQEAGRALSARESLATFSLIHAAGPGLFDARNPFPAGGVHEDPATGAAAAALAGYLGQGGPIAIRQGDDMGVPCRLFAQAPPVLGGSVRVWGQTRVM